MTHSQKIANAFERFVGVNILHQTVDGELFTELPDAQAYAVQLVSEAIVSINRPIASVPQETSPFLGKWVYLPYGVPSVLQNNLIVNGFGELGGTVNFSKFLPYVNNGTDAIELSNFGEQSFLLDTKVTAYTDGLIAIDPRKMYLLDFKASTIGEGNCDFEIGLQFYDQDFAPIELSYLSYNRQGVLLSAPLVSGDTQIRLNQAPIFENGEGSDGKRNLAFLNYAFANEKIAPLYAKNRIINAYRANGWIDTSDGYSVILNAPWSGVTIPAGVEVINPNVTGIMYSQTLSLSQTQNQTVHYRRAWGGNPDAFVGANPVNISGFARYAKLVVKQKSEQYFKLILSDVSLRELTGGDITVKHSSEIPVIAYDATLLPNGYEYYHTDGNVYVTLNGSWVSLNNTPYSVNPPPPPPPPPPTQ